MNLTINKTNSKDKSGIVIGLIKDNKFETSMKSIKTNSHSINGKGLKYVNNIKCTQDWVINNDSKVEIQVEDHIA